MAINTNLASLSETLWTAATGTYMLAVVCYTGEYAFGRNGRIARTSAPAAEAIPAREPALAGAGTSQPPIDLTTGRPAAPVGPAPVGPAPVGPAPVGPAPVEPTPGADSGRRWGL
ncbi:MAG: hypothetical protein ABI418_19375, partial [Jatrophihabitantaceae bacterium]